VVFIGFERRGAGSIGGVQPGDTLESVVARFGDPTSQGENLWFYTMDDRAVVVAEEMGRVAEIGIGFL
jgi:hypothetical protein